MDVDFLRSEKIYDLFLLSSRLTNAHPKYLKLSPVTGGCFKISFGSIACVFCKSRTQEKHIINFFWSHFIFVSISKAATSLLEIQSDEFDIDLKLILQHCPVTGDSFRYFWCAFRRSRTQGKREIYFFLFQKTNVHVVGRGPKLLFVSSCFFPLKVLFPCLKSIQVSPELI